MFALFGTNLKSSFKGFAHLYKNNNNRLIEAWINCLGIACEHN